MPPKAFNYRLPVLFWIWRALPDPTWIVYLFLLLATAAVWLVLPIPGARSATVGVAGVRGAGFVLRVLPSATLAGLARVMVRGFWACELRGVRASALI